MKIRIFSIITLLTVLKTVVLLNIFLEPEIIFQDSLINKMLKRTAFIYLYLFKIQIISNNKSLYYHFLLSI